MVLRRPKAMNDGEIVKEGHLKRLKTLKKRYFVLRSSPRKGKSRLEYYESEKKFRQKGPPKRVIYLDTCLNIAKKEDSKHKCVFALYTREDVFGLIADSEDELSSWLKNLKIEQRKHEILNASVSTWPVTVKPRGLGTSKKLTGQYNLQLSNRMLSLVTKDTREPITELQLVNIRRCGHTDCFFFMELGRCAATGAGELWIQVDDQIIAQNMHEAILGHGPFTRQPYCPKRLKKLCFTTLDLTVKNLGARLDRSMHNISQSISGELPQARRRCSSEGKRGRSKPRPVSAVLYPMSRGRSGTEPGSSLSPYRHSESPGNKQQASVLNRLMPRRKSRDVTESIESSCSNQDDSKSDFRDKVLVSPPLMIHPSEQQKDDQPEYVNVGTDVVDKPGSTEDYMKMDGNRRRKSDSYIDMAPTKSQAVKAVTLTTLEGGYMDMTSLRQHADKQTEKIQSSSMRSEFVQQKKSSSPRQLRTSESPLPNKPNIREFVSLKKSPASVRRNSSQDYIDMSPLAARKDRLYVNCMPGSNPREYSSSSDLSSVRDLSRSYVNFVPGENVEEMGKHLETQTPQIRVNNTVDSSSNQEMHSYVNFSPGNTEDKKIGSNNFRKRSLESVLLVQTPEYVNVDFSGISKSRSAVDMPEYVNFVPGRLLENKKLDNPVKPDKPDNPLTNGKTEKSLEEEVNYVNLSPGEVVVENERWQKSPRSGRRESEPARLHPHKCMANSTLDSTKEDEEAMQLNYVILDLSKDDAKTSESPSRRRPRPVNIDLSSCHRASPGPKSAPVKSAYAEVDFTKSHGIRQARQETRDTANIT